MNTTLTRKAPGSPVLRFCAAAGAIGSLLALTSGCVVYRQPPPAAVVYQGPVAAPGEVVVDQDPPAPVAEVVGVAPGPGFVWVGGYYHWYGNRWGWNRGHWVRPPRAGARWIGGHVEWRAGRRVYIGGYWR